MSQENLERTPMFDGKTYASQEGIKIERKELVTGFDLRCIDDREGRRGEDLPPFAVPGSGLGIIMDVMAAAYEAVTTEGGMGIKGRGLNPRSLFEAAKAALDGVVLFHTDTVHGKDFPCAGCGYCAASLKNPENNFFSQVAADFLKYETLEACQKDLADQGISVPTYEGPHIAKAVMVVDGHTIALPSTGADGDHVYVLHASVRDELLMRVADAVFPQLQALVPDFDQSAWKQTVIDLAGKRLDQVVKGLGADKLPMFHVTEKDGVIDAELISTPAEEEVVAA